MEVSSFYANISLTIIHFHMALYFVSQICGF